DAVTLLEVLGQVNDSAAVLRSVLRVAQRFVIISVSTRVDDENPGPIYSEPQLSDLLRAQGLIRLSFERVPGHLIALARVASHGA
ncbi:MAG: hypothetical protein HGA65_16040, partial [Oscillochloris sp.]|nr:hypothetical protein [Oscillochloris sp.]